MKMWGARPSAANQRSTIMSDAFGRHVVPHPNPAVARAPSCDTVGARLLDIYENWIVAHVDGVWRHCRLVDGFVCVASFDQPNRHRGVVRKRDITSASGEVSADDLAISPFLWIGAQVVDEAILTRIAIVRFGLCAQLWGRFTADTSAESCAIRPAIEQGWFVPAGEPQPTAVAGLAKYQLPSMPARWRRTARSLMLS